MSERGNSGCATVAVAVPVLVSVLFLIYALDYRLRRQDDWIRDLQRRVGQLEQRR